MVGRVEGLNRPLPFCCAPLSNTTQITIPQPSNHHPQHHQQHIPTDRKMLCHTRSSLSSQQRQKPNVVALQRHTPCVRARRSSVTVQAGGTQVSALREQPQRSLPAYLSLGVWSVACAQHARAGADRISPGIIVHCGHHHRHTHTLAPHAHACMHACIRSRASHPPAPTNCEQVYDTVADAMTSGSVYSCSPEETVDRGRQ